jgi:hypothetical protein
MMWPSTKSISPSASRTRETPARDLGLAPLPNGAATEFVEVSLSKKGLDRLLEIILWSPISAT